MDSTGKSAKVLAYAIEVKPIAVADLAKIKDFKPFAIEASKLVVRREKVISDTKKLSDKEGYWLKDKIGGVSLFFKSPILAKAEYEAAEKKRKADLKETLKKQSLERQKD